MSYSEDTIDFLHQGDLIGMQNSLAKALSNDDDEMLADLAEYLQMMGFIDESQKVYDKIMGDHPESTAYLINLAEIAEDNGNLDEALSYLYQIPQTDENYVAALVKIADLYQFDGDFETAISKLEEARELSDSPLITFALAESYYDQGDYSAAINEYVKLSERKILHDTKISIYQRIGDSYAQLGDFEKAISFLEKSFEFDKKAETLYEIALLYSEIHNETRAIANFKRLEKMDVDFLNYELAYAQTLEANQEFEAALAMAEQGLQKNPNAVALLHFASKMSFKLKNTSAAERYLMDALNLPDLHDETVFLLANLYFNEEDFEAVIHLQDLLEDEHLLAKWLFAGAHKALENDSEAESLYQELHQTSLSENPEFLADYIEFLREIGQNKQAEPLIKQYLALVPDDQTMENLLTEDERNY
ncbi:tetratricopeptide repeat protein [Lactococcus kimchii]|uniref:tetratricopeptide repeat protein n=1 Tax=Lactococcus sp. S-13 TaxID=2507158 RepID=UPI001023E84C|nr:tetratricopeptide repeat protein [Lactococcus sp. S-13]RZI48269.1 tetratricopeptide repeat protein [Lactococcus sp. S-13]